jgi:hypothetical protein
MFLGSALASLHDNACCPVLMFSGKGVGPSFDLEALIEEVGDMLADGGEGLLDARTPSPDPEEVKTLA